MKKFGSLIAASALMGGIQAQISVGDCNNIVLDTTGASGTVINDSTTLGSYNYGWEITIDEEASNSYYYCSHEHIYDFTYTVTANDGGSASDLVADSWTMTGSSASSCSFDTTDATSGTASALTASTAYATSSDSGGTYCGYYVEY